MICEKTAPSGRKYTIVLSGSEEYQRVKRSVGPYPTKRVDVPDELITERVWGLLARAERPRPNGSRTHTGESSPMPKSTRKPNTSRGSDPTSRRTKRIEDDNRRGRNVEIIDAHED